MSEGRHIDFHEMVADETFRDPYVGTSVFALDVLLADLDLFVRLSMCSMTSMPGVAGTNASRGLHELEEADEDSVEW